MSHTNNLFNLFLNLPLDKPCLCPMASESNLKTVRSSLYKIRSFYEKQTNSSVCMNLRRVTKKEGLFLEMTRSKVQFQLYETDEDGNLVPLNIEVKSNVASRRDISGPGPLEQREPVSAHFIRRRLGQMKEDKKDHAFQIEYLKSEFSSKEEGEFIDKLLVPEATPQAQPEPMTSPAPQTIPTEDLHLLVQDKRKKLQAEGYSLEESIETLQELFPLSQEEIFALLDKPEELTF